MPPDSQRTDVRIEPVALRHAPDIQRLASDARIAATTRVPHPYPDDGAVRFVEEADRARAAGEAFSFAVIASGNYVGSCGLKGVRVGDGGREAELGYWIGVPYWGRGYATAAARLVVAYGFEALGLDRITAHTLDGNATSAHVLERLGFRHVGRGVAPDDCGEGGGATDNYELRRGAWEAGGSQRDASRTRPQAGRADG